MKGGILLGDGLEMCNVRAEDVQAYSNGPKVSFWIPSSDDLRIVRKSVLSFTLNPFILRSGSDEILVEPYVGFESDEIVSKLDGVILCMPQTGLSDKMLNLRFTDYDSCFIFRLLSSSELECLPSDRHPPSELAGQAKKAVSTHPYIAPLDDASRDSFFRWLEYATVSMSARWSKNLYKERLRELQSEGKVILREAGPLPSSIVSRNDLSHLLIARNSARKLLTNIDNTNNQLAMAEEKLKPEKARNREWEDQLDRAVSLIKKMPAKSALGAELAPELQALLRRVRTFSDSLYKQPTEEVASLGKELLQRLQDRPPTLALIGSFSSGKTTLLNALVADGQSTRQFRTSTVANTALVTEIEHAARKNDERVEFRFRETVDHVLYDSREGNTSLARNLEGLQQLIDSGVLKSIEIRQIPESHKNRRKIMKYTASNHSATHGRKLTIKNKLAVIKYLQNLSDDPDSVDLFIGGASSKKASKSRRKTLRIEQVIFKATVDSLKVTRGDYPGSLPQQLDLSSERGWSRFQGTQTSKKPLTESVTATFLVEHCEVSLSNDLLKLTTLADTPGTGSRNDRHDVITESYLNRAEGFIILLPSKRLHSLRVQEIIDLLAKEMSRRHNGDAGAGLDSLAFVVNCFTTHDESARQDAVTEYEKFIRRAFKVPPRRWPKIRDRCFFVVNLRSVLVNGANPRTLYNRNSMLPLRDWVSKLFSHGGYRHRLEGITDVLENSWRKSRNVLVTRIRDLKQTARERKNRIKKIEKYANEELPKTTSDFRCGLQHNRDLFSSTKRNRPIGSINRALASYAEKPESKSELDTCRRIVVNCYKELNEKLDEGLPISDWVDEISVKTSELGVSWSKPLTPNPASQSPKWSTRRRLNFNGVNNKAKKLKGEWPGFFRKHVEKVKGIFTDSLYDQMAEEMNSYVTQQLNSVIKPYQEYLNRMEKWLNKQEELAFKQCISATEKLERASDSIEAARLLEETEQKVANFAEFEAKRRSLVKEFSEFLESGKRR